jgi:hypothetical protein
MVEEFLHQGLDRDKIEGLRKADREKYVIAKRETQTNKLNISKVDFCVSYPKLDGNEYKETLANFIVAWSENIF